MKFKWNNKYIRWGMTSLFVIIASILFYYLLFHSSDLFKGVHNLMNVVMPIVIGLVLAYLLTPVLNYIESNILTAIYKWLKIKDSPKSKSIKRMIGIVFTALLFFLLIYSLISMLLSQIVPSIENIITNFDRYISNFNTWLNKLLADNPDIKDYAMIIVNKYSSEFEIFLNQTVLSKSSELIMTVSLSVIGMLKVLWNFILGFMISIYVLGSKEKFAGQSKKIVYAFFERDSANVIINNFRFTHNTFIGFLGGKIIDSIIIGFLCLIGTSLLNTPYAALISVIIGFTNIIPFFGPYLGAIPSIILIFVVDPMNPLNCVYFALFILALQQFDGNVLGPKILGDSTGLSGFWVIFSITLFGGFFGVLGMIVGVPIFAVIYACIRSFVSTKLLKRNMPIITKEYYNVEYIDQDGGAQVYSENPDEKKLTKKKKKEAEEQSNKIQSGKYFISGADEWAYRYHQKEHVVFDRNENSENIEN